VIQLEHQAAFAPWAKKHAVLNIFKQQCTNTIVVRHCRVHCIGGVTPGAASDLRNSYAVDQSIGISQISLFIN